MTNKEIDKAKEKLVEIQKLPDSEQHKRLKELQILAKEVGGSTKSWQPIGGETVATESALIDHINDSLRTASMVDMCRSSATMCEIAARNYKIALVAAIIAALSALAAWVAVLIR